MPSPFRRSTLSGCVPGGTFMTVVPFKVGTSIFPPSTAVTKLIGTSQLISLPLRWNTGCGLTAMAT